MGYQFIHIETYAKVSSRNNKKQSAKAVAQECERDLHACPHVKHPEPYKLLYGLKPSDVVKKAEIQAEKAKDKLGRRLRKDAQILLAGVVSYPTPLAEFDPNCRNFRRWLELNHQFLKSKYGSKYKSLVLHTDEHPEGFPHCHFYVVPDLDNSNHLNIGTVHQGIEARDKLKSPSAKEKLRAYKSAMREYQDEYQREVGIHCGLTRIGPRKRRLTRQEWALEKSASKQLSIKLSKIKKLNLLLKQKEKILIQTNTKENNYKRGTYNELSQ
ncbi:Plasmid recombination enzyme [Vibrio crassostreae]|uniref:plasmid recombination protein n=1 Tax=Vibrio crassostreae TaxID=246167 RepID=UPI001B316688|nr:plasmid recombination protein [Vibrio crassostreae]CAK2028376.1 Plasmid recombination enzyme [Vibrio crassostreae]CAK2032084.1 Plasmid recombination enzyme [Vibrio crassostreae]CAK2033721.1 Plasmid recombination enzyme [Vibrio crassostreae]CAK2034831.1 Plasmid recombination enzyme [Vibrio crassostreae]CAK2036276.1 Plasmid recombination enzyme [Vibrio crassostreae]